MLVLAPLVGIFGAVALFVVFGVTVVAPFCAVILLINGQFAWAALSLGSWLLWLRFGRPVRRFVFEGFEHGGL